MRISGLFFVTLAVVVLFAGLTPHAQAVEEGQLVKKEGKWEYYSGEDPGLKYLYLKGIITEEEYNKGLRVLENKERISKPNFNIDVNNGLNIRVGEKFFLKIRLLSQIRYTSHNYNSAWGSVGDARNSPDVLGGQVEFRALKQQSSVSDFTAPRTRLQFLGYAFDPDFRYNVSFQVDQNERAQGINGTAGLLDAYVSSWHIPWATIQAGQQTVWFNRALITSVATTAFADNMIVQNAFAANLVNRRDIGITVLSNEDNYRFNYAFGIWNGTGTNLTREGTSVSQATPNNSSLPNNNTRRTYNFDTRFLTSELMYTARLLYKISGNPGYGQGDILNSRAPQVAIGAAYAYDPAQNYLSSIRSDIVDQSLRTAVANSYNGRLLGGGIYDFQTYNVDFVAKYQGYSLQAEGYYRHQRVRSNNSQVIAYDPTTNPNGFGSPTQPNLGQAYGWYVQTGKYLIPRKLELAIRYGVMDPSTLQTHDLIKEFGAAINYSFDGTYNNRLIIDYSNITMGSGGNAPDRAIYNGIPGSGRDLIENRINVQYQFYF
jgi:hypothetical protein